jgi:hypothetical protein
MLFKEIIAVYSENRTELIDTLCGENAELMTVKAGGTYNYHWSLKGLFCSLSCYVVTEVLQQVKDECAGFRSQTHWNRMYASFHSRSCVELRPISSNHAIFVMILYYG